MIQQEFKGDPLKIFKIFRKKVHNAEKIERGPFSLARYCILHFKKEQPFWVSSLGQMVQLDSLKICRTSCGLKKRVTIIVSFHFLKRRLKPDVNVL